VIATTEGSVVVLDSRLEEVARFDPPDGSAYRQPTWLDRDTVVFAELSEVRDFSLTAVDVESGETAWRSEMTSSPFFFAPAPLGSEYATTSLRNNPGADLISELIDDAGVAVELATESPFYTSWEPSGERLAVHVPGRRVDIIDGAMTQTIVEPSNGFQTPVWLDDGLVLLRDAEAERFLSIWNDEEFRDMAVIEGAAIFVARGTRVAIKTTGSDDTREDSDAVQASLRVQELPTLPTERLVVVDVVSGSIDPVTAEPTAVYQWDAGGDRLLYGVASVENGLTWWVWEAGASTELASFRPNRQWVGELVPFFDQYAQSVQMWSSTGDRIAVPVAVEGRAEVAVIGIDGSEPTLIPNALWASWVPVDR